MSARIDPKTPLKQCPFCGCVPKLSLGKIAPGWFQIECVSSREKCPAYLYVIGRTEEEATERWNKRFVSTQCNVRITCPSCKSEQVASVERIPIFDSLIHECSKCGYVITESEWEEVKK